MAEVSTSSASTSRYNIDMPASTRILVVQNDADKTLGRIATSLEASGADLDQRSSTTALPSLDAYQGLVVLPGLADPVDDVPAVHRARAVVRDAHTRDLPLLGLCLGAQLVAQVTGGAVYRSAVEVGYADVDATPEAATDPLLCAAPPRFAAFHAHAYAFTAPPGATILARNPTCVQAMRVGDRTWAIQFHPETTLDWVENLAAALSGPQARSTTPAHTAGFFRSHNLQPQTLLAAAHDAMQPAAAIADQIAAGFLGVCRAVAGQHATNR